MLKMQKRTLERIGIEMTTIKQLLAMPIGQKWGGDDFVVKIAGKKWQEANKEWTQHIVLSDKTGEIDVDVNIGRNVPLVKGGRIHIVVSEIQSATNKIGKKLYVEQFTQPTQIGEPDDMDFYNEDWQQKNQEIIKGKIRHGICCSILTREHPDAVLAMKKSILELQDFIMTGE